MTGLLPHHHGVLQVEHGVDDDQAVLRTGCPHFAQQLVGAGYRTGYFGKWHIARTLELDRLGWQVDGTYESDLLRQFAATCEVVTRHQSPTNSSRRRLAQSNRLWTPA